MSSIFRVFSFFTWPRVPAGPVSNAASHHLLTLLLQLSPTTATASALVRRRCSWGRLPTCASACRGAAESVVPSNDAPELLDRSGSLHAIDGHSTVGESDVHTIPSAQLIQVALKGVPSEECLVDGNVQGLCLVERGTRRRESLQVDPLRHKRLWLADLAHQHLDLCAAREALRAEVLVKVQAPLDADLRLQQQPREPRSA
jgi:hypothetical protein